MNGTKEGRDLHVPWRRICAVCGRVLLHHEGQGYAHPLADPSLADHPAVPVLDTDVTVNERCDFCFADHTEWMLPASNFEVPVARISLYGTVGIESDERHGNAGDWGACSECAELIRANAWPKLIKRVRDCWPHVHSGNLMPEERYTNTYRLYRELRKHITGPLVPTSQVVDL